MMKFKIQSWRIQDLEKAHAEKKLNLNPSYQRNDIWTLKAQKDLITTIQNGMPIPNLFFHKRGVDNYDITDGQQRTRAILAYINGEISDASDIKFDKHNNKEILEYLIPVLIISEKVTEEEIRMFYVKVNNTGLRVNQPELRKAIHFDSELLKMIEDLTTLDEFVSLGIFNEKQSDRMLDREFIEELVSQLNYEKITDKKSAITKLYDDKLTKTEINQLRKRFLNVLKVFTQINKKFLISETRYAQKNDFYTLFGFVKNNIDFSQDSFDKCFEVLNKIQFDISPSNEKCPILQEYAFHCVSQSNSKNARERRLEIINEILLNTNKNPNSTQKQLLRYYNLPISEIIKIEGYITLSPKKIKRKFTEV